MNFLRKPGVLFALGSHLSAPLLLRNSRTTDALRHGGMGEFLALWCRAFAAFALLRNSRTTDSLRHGRMGEFLASWCRALAAYALLRKSTVSC